MSAFSSAHGYQSLAEQARSRAREAMHQGNPIRAREWIEAAAAADRAAVSYVYADINTILAPHFGGPEDEKPNTVEMARQISARLATLTGMLRRQGIDTAKIPWPEYAEFYGIDSEEPPGGGE